MAMKYCLEYGLIDSRKIINEVQKRLEKYKNKEK